MSHRPTSTRLAARIRRTLRVAALMVAGGVTSVQAHPHVFVDAGAGFDFDAQGRLVGLRIIWRYDAFTSLTLFDILDLDRDGDGQLDDADRAAIVSGETTWAEGYKGDTYLEMGGKDIPLTQPEAGQAWMAEDQISVGFRLPLAEPLELTGPVALLLYDPTYYYAYKVVTLDPEAPEGCRITLRAFEPDAATAELQAQLAALSREETPEQDGVGRLFADEVWVSCD